MTTHKIRQGDVVIFDRKQCRVARVTDCCAVLEVPTEPRTFTTLFGQTVTLQPKPRTIRISADACLPTLNR